MIVLNTKSAIRLITQSGCRWCNIYEGHVPQIKDSYSDNETVPTVFMHFECETPKELAEKVGAFADDYQYRFTLALKEAPNTKFVYQKIVRVDFSESPKEEKAAPINGPSSVDVEKIIRETENRIRLEYELKAEKERRDNEVKGLRDELEGLKNWGNKLGYAGSVLISEIFTSYGNSQLLNGGTMVGRSLSQLKEDLGEERIIKLAVYFQTENGKLALEKFREMIDNAQL